MRFLILGGTAFVGRHIVQEALAAGHELTLFNRGVTNPSLFGAVETRKGDRTASDLASLEAGEWDAVVDVNGYVPRVVDEMAATLKDRVGTYCFISTGSVYADHGPIDTDEDARLLEYKGEPTEEITDRSYGPLKVLCERAAQAAYPDASLIIRPGIVAGPYDPTDRFTYWARRIARGGRVLGPERPDQPVQLVHAQDQARFIVRMLEERARGAFNTVGPDEAMTFAEMVAGCAVAAGADVEMVWAPEKVLSDNGVTLQLAMPANGSWDGTFRRSNQRGKDRGFRNRPIAELAADTLEWDRTRDQARTGAKMVTEAQEAQVLALL